MSDSLQLLLNRKGRPVTYTSYVPGSYSAGTGLTLGASTDYTVKCYFSEYMANEVDGKSILVGDSKIAMSVVDTSGVAIPEPSNDDVIAELNIVGVQTIYDGIAKRVYIVQARE